MKLKRRFWWVRPECIDDGTSGTMFYPQKWWKSQVRVEVRLAPKRRKKK
jgi:hypothetical protein